MVAVFPEFELEVPNGVIGALFLAICPSRIVVL
jgi:hypothetical protein